MDGMGTEKQQVLLAFFPLGFMVDPPRTDTPRTMTLVIFEETLHLHGASRNDARLKANNKQQTAPENLTGLHSWELTNSLNICCGGLVLCSIHSLKLTVRT